MFEMTSRCLCWPLSGPLRSAFADVHCHDWRVQMMGDIQGWGAYGGSKEARLTLRHTLQAHTNPALQVKRNTPKQNLAWVLLCVYICVLM